MADTPDIHFATIRRLLVENSEITRAGETTSTGTPRELWQRIHDCGDAYYVVQLDHNEHNYLYRVSGGNVARYREIDGQPEWVNVNELIVG